MKSLAILCAVVLLTTQLSACFNTDLVAPENTEVTILTADAPAEFRAEYKNVYLLGGILPIWTVQPEEYITREKLVEVRVQTEDTVSDGVITFITALIFLGLFPQTVVVEGNRAPSVEPVVQPEKQSQVQP